MAINKNQKLKFDITKRLIATNDGIQKSTIFAQYSLVLKDRYGKFIAEFF